MTIHDPKRRLAALLLLVLGLSSAVSHFLVHWLEIRTVGPSWDTFGGGTNQPVQVLGSSLTLLGVDWQGIATELGRPVVTFGVPAASPAEIEAAWVSPPAVAVTVVGISLFDMNESSVSDFRAEVVPLTRTLADLRATRTPMSLTKRVLSQYPLKAVRVLFPTAGRSIAVMVGLRGKLRAVLRGGRAGGGNPGGDEAMNAVQGEARKDRLSDWPEDQRLRNVAIMRDRFAGTVLFGGVKQLALERLVAGIERRDQVLLVVLPLSPTFGEAFITPAAQAAFEGQLRALQQRHPGTSVLRLDQDSRFARNDFYFDLAHLNAYGREVATEAVAGRLRTGGLRP